MYIIIIESQLIINFAVTSELQAVCVGITKLHSRLFIVTTVYKPPNASLDFFDDHETLINQIHDENKEVYLMGDLNCDVLKEERFSDTATNKLNSFAGKTLEF